MANKFFLGLFIILAGIFGLLGVMKSAWVMIFLAGVVIIMDVGVNIIKKLSRLRSGRDDSPR